MVINGKQGKGRAHGSFGEIIQGSRLEDSKSYLVTMPINLFSESIFFPSDEGNELNVIPSNKTKSLEAITILKNKKGLCSGTLKVYSEIPEGKGLSSSSADIVSAIRAYASTNDITISNEEIGNIISEIEPSDAVMFDSCVAFYNLSGECFIDFNYVPNLTILGIDEGGIIDTCDCYAKRLKQSSKVHQLQEQLLEELITSFKERDIYKIGNICTQSAIINQSILPKKYLQTLIDIKNKFNLPGIIISHTGTYQGIMIDRDDEQYSYILNKISHELMLKKIKFKKIHTFIDM